jgi:PiT family inorganic phosphate transporter
MSVSIIALIILALLYTFLNGVNDSSNLAATVISSRAMGARAALMMIATGVFVGPLFLGMAVAHTIGGEVIDPSLAQVGMLLAALSSAILFGLLTWSLGVPSSSSHALIGGMLGAAWVGAGLKSIHMTGVEKVFAALFISPLVGLLAGFMVTRLVFYLARNATPSANGFFKRAQIVTSLALAVTYGANDAQKAMGVITLGLTLSGYLDTFHVPVWVIILCAAGLAAGSAVGGQRLIRTMGGRFYKIKPLDAFCTQAGADLVVLSASLFGGPVSTTQVVSTAILGVGAAERVNKVRWGVALDIILAWLVTIPLTALLAAGLYWLGSQFL